MEGVLEEPHAVVQRHLRGGVGGLRQLPVSSLLSELKQLPELQSHGAPAQQAGQEPGAGPGHETHLLPAGRRKSCTDGDTKWWSETWEEAGRDEEHQEGRLPYFRHIFFFFKVKIKKTILNFNFVVHIL